jgi:hypothetical protein
MEGKLGELRGHEFMAKRFLRRFPPLTFFKFDDEKLLSCSSLWVVSVKTLVWSWTFFS